MGNLQKKLLDNGLISEQHFNQIEAVSSRKVISLHYELRLLLYLGIMLFTGGVGYIVYQNMSDIGHIALMFLMVLAIGAGGYFIHVKAEPYANGVVKVEAMYFDYLLVLVSLLVISLFTYIQVYFDLVAILINWTSLVSAFLFFYLAYRYDNKMVLSMGIVAFVAVFGLAVSPLGWAKAKWLEGTDMYLLSVFIGGLLLLIGQVLDYKGIKRHFTFSYHNFGWLLFFFGALSLVFDSGHGELGAVLLLSFLSFLLWYYWKQKAFLFFLYGCLAAYIMVSYLFYSFDPNWELWVLYLPLTSIGGILLLLKNKSHFSDDT